MVYHYLRANSSRLTVAILKIAMTPQLCRGWSDPEEIW